MTSSTFDINTTIDEVISRFGENGAGKTYILTGASVKSLAAGAAEGLAAADPKRIMLIGRSEERTQPVIEAIKKRNPNVATDFIQVDLMDLASVRQGAEKIKSITSEIHGLINSAGIMAVEKYQESKDGIESQFATNHIAHFLLTNLLKDELSAGKGVVVNLSSGGYELADINYDDVNFDHGKTYNSWVAYAQAKTANILFTVSIAEKAKKHNIVSFAVNPGLVAETALQSNSSVTQEHFMEGFRLFQERNEGRNPPMPTQVTIAQGAATMVLPLLDPKLRASSGSTMHECQHWPVKDYATDSRSAERLWAISERLVGQEFGW